MTKAELLKKLKYDVEKINEKFNKDRQVYWWEEGYLNQYQKARLEGMKTKCNELIKLLEADDEENSRSSKEKL